MNIQTLNISLFKDVDVRKYKRAMNFYAPRPANLGLIDISPIRAISVVERYRLDL